MSDPAKTPEEIEDVLASVRRLVSDHAPSRDEAAQMETPAPKADAAPAPIQAEALVLTPSFRVTDPEDPWVPVQTSEEADTPLAEDTTAEGLIANIVTADATPEATEPSIGTDDADWQPDDRLASFDAVGEADEAPMPREWVDDHSDEASEDDIADLIRLDGSNATVSDFESETGDDNWPESGVEAALLTLVARRDPTPEAKGAPEVEAANDDAETSEIDEAPQAEVSENSDVLSLVPEMEERSTENEAALEDVAEHVEPSEDHVQTDPEREDETTEVEAEIVDAPTDSALDEMPIFARATVGDVAERLIDEPVEDEGASEDALTEDTLTKETTAEDQPAEDASIEDLGDTPSPFTFPETDEGILDEDTLREIIVDVVREELQGVLGQRITRNVRKMVRREIRLALAAEDLE